MQRVLLYNKKASLLHSKLTPKYIEQHNLGS